MLKRLISEDSERSCHSYTVIRSESGTLGSDPFSVHICRNGPGGEIKTLVIAFTHHIHMPLQNYRGRIFMPGGGRHTEHYIAHCIGLCSYIVLPGKVQKICANFLLLLGGTRNTCNLVKYREHCLGLKIFDFHILNYYLRWFLSFNFRCF